MVVVDVGDDDVSLISILIKRLVASAVGKIHKLQTAKLREIEAPWLTLLPTGGAFWPAPSNHNSRTLSSRLPKLSDFSFLLFGHIVAKFQVN